MTKSRAVNLRFVVHVFTLILSVIALLLLVASLLVLGPARDWLAPPLSPTAPPPLILAPRGDMPRGPVGFVQWNRYSGSAYQIGGSGFFLQLGQGAVVGVAVAHGTGLGDPQRPLERMAYSIEGRSGYISEFDTLYGMPGEPLSTANLLTLVPLTFDLSRDYLLLRVDQPLDPAWVLAPDPRGLPQPGERVSMYAGPVRAGKQQTRQGTVLSSHTKAVWVLMDEKFAAAGLSGSPFVSQHTGAVVGMTIVESERGEHLLLGLHPIGSLVHHAERAHDDHILAGYRRK